MLAQLFPGMDTEILNDIKAAAGSMGEATSKLKGEDAPGAIPPEQDVIRRLSQSQQGMQQMAQQMAMRMQAARWGYQLVYDPRPGWYYGPWVPMPTLPQPELNRPREKGYTGIDKEEFEPPSKDAYKVPKVFREKIMESLKEGIPSQYRREVEDYFRGLSRMTGFRHLPKHNFKLPEENSAITKIPPGPPLLKGGKFLLPLKKGGWEGFYFSILLILTVFVILGPHSILSQEVSRDVITALTEKLEAWDVENAWQEMKGLLEKDPKDPRLLELASQIAFHRGEYQEALRLMKSAIEQGGDNDKRRGFALFIEESIGVLSPFKQYESAHFRISLDEKQDGILADYIIDALERTYQLMARTVRVPAQGEDQD